MKCCGQERECLSGEILRARTLLSARSEEGAVLLREVKEALVAGLLELLVMVNSRFPKLPVVALPQVPHGLCHFHYLRSASK